jgi:transcriptional regulator with XRE-family HTH domain
MAEVHDQLRVLVGKRIRALRRTRGISAQELADMLHWPLDTLVNYEYGRRPLQIDRLAALGSALGVPPAALLIADPLTADLVVQLSTNSGLVREVRFFIDTLQAESAQPSENHIAESVGADSQHAATHSDTTE